MDVEVYTLTLIQALNCVFPNFVIIEDQRTYNQGELCVSSSNALTALHYGTNAFRTCFQSHSSSEVQLLLQSLHPLEP